MQISDPRPDEWVTLASPVDHDGRVLEAARNKIVMSVVGLQADTTVATFGGPTPVSGDQYAMVPAPLNLNIFVLFTANFGDGNYPAGLGMISRVIGFFQQHPVFTGTQMPDLPASMDRLALEFINIDFAQANYLMGMLGMKYLPSALYRIRMLRFDGQTIASVSPATRAMNPKGDPASGPANRPVRSSGRVRPAGGSSDA